MASDTRKALLRAAERAARTRGFDGFSYADLAAAVGIRKASIHHHFATKADLSLALMQGYRVEMEAVLKAVDKTCATGAARLDALIGRYRDALDGGKSLCLCVAFSVGRSSLSDEVILEIGRFRAMMIDWIETVYALGRADGTIGHVSDPAMEAAATLPLLEGAQLTARAGEDPALFETAVALLAGRVAPSL